MRLGVDVGTVRVGVARSDPDGLLATPETTVPHVPGRHEDAQAVAALAREVGARAVYVGLPRTLAGGESASARRARDFAQALLGSLASAPAAREGSAPPEVRLVDERLTTVDASRQMRESGRRARAQRQVIDQAAAVLILQVALDRERSTGRRAGAPVDGPTPEQDPSARTGTVQAEPGSGRTARPRKPRHRRGGAATGSAAGDLPPDRRTAT